jgi:hypothetical protein
MKAWPETVRAADFLVKPFKISTLGHILASKSSACQLQIA